MEEAAKNVPQQLAEVAEALKKGQAVEHVRVRDFLKWFDVERRGYQNTRYIRAALDAVGLLTTPDFDQISYYSYVTFKLASGDSLESSDPTVRILRFEEISKDIRSCKPDDPLTKIVQTMIMEDYSQLPVITSPREVKGMVTWDAIARAAILGKEHAIASDVMEQAHETTIDAPLSDVIPMVASQGYALVRNKDHSLFGILTSSDLNVILVGLSGAFLSLGEIENYLRRLIRHKFTKAQLKAACFEDGREVLGPQDLTLGELIRLIEAESNWPKLGLLLERNEFIQNLNVVRSIRNSVMHFDPEGVPPDDQRHLTKFVALLREIAR